MEFFRQEDGGLMHYNGSNIELLYPTDMFIVDVAVFPRDVFISCLTPESKPVVVHGTLP